MYVQIGGNDEYQHFRRGLFSNKDEKVEKNRQCRKGMDSISQIFLCCILGQKPLYIYQKNFGVSYLTQELGPRESRNKLTRPFVNTKAIRK